MTKKLFFEAIGKIIVGFILVSLVLFLSAGTYKFLNGWILLLVLFIPMFFAGVIMMFKNPELLKRRLYAKEEQKEQNYVVAFSGVMFVIGFIVAGLDFRFGWSNLPKSIVLIGVLVFLLGYAIYALVISKNSYLFRTIRVEDNQKVVDTGVYGIVRHPMYSATILLFLSMPVILGSMWSFLVFLTYPFIIIKRIKYEEEFLENKLKGYKEYRQKIKYRLIPFIW